MNILDIPFVKTVGLTKAADGSLMLAMSPAVANHLNTMHASAQFMLAETASGQLLIESYPEVVGKTVPVLREAQIKFKRPAESTVTAHAEVSAEVSAAFLEQFARRWRSMIECLWWSTMRLAKRLALASLTGISRQSQRRMG
jgi:hypothetical protein